MERRRLVLHNKSGIESILHQWFYSGAFLENSFYIRKIESENKKATIFIAEDYYFRIDSNLTVTVIVEEVADKTIVEIISSGGKGRWGLSFGAEKSAVKSIMQLLKENGFTEQ